MFIVTIGYMYKIFNSDSLERPLRLETFRFLLRIQLSLHIRILSCVHMLMKPCFQIMNDPLPTSRSILTKRRINKIA